MGFGSTERASSSATPRSGPGSGSDGRPNFLERVRGRALRAVAALNELPLSLRVVLFGAAILHGWSLSWGMPGSDAWDNDGVAPRDFVPGLAATLSPGDYNTYPPLHLALLSLLTLPFTAVAALRAGSSSVTAVLREVISPVYMTGMAMTARIVALLMSLGIVLALGKVAEEIVGHGTKGGQAAAVWTAAFASVGVPLTYYAHTSNLDVPYLFWGALAIFALVRAVVRHELRRLRHAAAFAAFAIATKDQAYAMFALALPLTIATFVATDRWARANARQLWRELAIATALAIFLVLLIDGAFVNPTGLRARLGFLAGSASQNFATYSRDNAGRVAIVTDTIRHFAVHYPALAAPFVAVGGVLAVRGRAADPPREAGRTAAALVPLFVAISFTLAFNLAARRVEERFTMPQMVVIATYAGIGLAAVMSVNGLARWPLRAAAIAVLAFATWRAASVDATLAHEPRYETEAYLAAHVRPGDTVEVHGLNVYLPRLDTSVARVTRVGPVPVTKRGPLPGVEEIVAPLTEIESRRPRFIVVSQCYVWRYLQDTASRPAGMIVPVTQNLDAADTEATTFFRALFEGRLRYRLVDHAKPEAGFFEVVRLHGSLGCEMFTFERVAPPS